MKEGAPVDNSEDGGLIHITGKVVPEGSGKLLVRGKLKALHHEELTYCSF